MDYFFTGYGSLFQKNENGTHYFNNRDNYIVCMLTMLTLYSSPWISGPNTALTYGDKNGIDWILEYRNAKIPIVREDGSLYKYSNYYYESTNATEK